MKIKFVFLVLLIFSQSSVAFESVEDKDYEILTKIASGRSVEKDKAASTVSIITEKEIEEMGAIELSEVLETVPGLHVKKNNYIRSNTYVMRGIGTRYNPEVLFLINNIPIISPSTGNRTQGGWGGMPVSNIKRVEIIRGPGSALYGADAYAGVINIILKSNDVGEEVKILYGENQAKNVFAQSGGGNESFNYYASIDISETEGYSPRIDFDNQSYLDNLFNTNSSLSPGEANFQKKMYDAFFSLKYKDYLKISILHQSRRDMGIGFNLNDVLIDSSKIDNSRTLYSIDFNKEYNEIKYNSKLSYYRMKEWASENVKLYPDGAYGGVFNNGVIGSPERTEDFFRIDNNVILNVFENHYLNLGLGYSNSSVLKTKEKKNFDFNFQPLPNGIIELNNNDEGIFLNPRDRDNIYAFVQDEWYLGNDITVTSGIRYDWYSDFGSTINPRFAFVWDTSRKLTSKFLYGRAFRAPSISELYVTSNPYSLGNEDLKPEIIDTFELNFNYRFDFDTFLSWNLFYYEAKDYLSLEKKENETFQMENLGRIKGHGTEVEFSHKINENLKFYTNYSYYKNKNESENEESTINPSHMFYSRLTYDDPKLNINLQGNWISDRKRKNNDLRKDLKGYYKIDFNVKIKNILDIKRLDAMIYFKNLTNEDIREPSVDGGMKNDYPMPGRNAHFGLNYQF